MIKIGYSLLLLFILSGVYFIITQGTEAVFSFSTSTLLVSLIISSVVVFVRKKWNIDAFGMASFLTILVVGVGKILAAIFS